MYKRQLRICFHPRAYQLLQAFNVKNIQFGTRLATHIRHTVFKPHIRVTTSYDTRFLRNRDPHCVLLRLQIPESAVEMPGDPVSSLDVKFGGLDFGLTDTKPSFTTSTESDQDGFSSTGQSAVTATVEQQSLAPLPTASQSVKVGHLSRFTPRF